VGEIAADGDCGAIHERKNVEKSGTSRRQENPGI
jgi:hypothetical protein